MKDNEELYGDWMLFCKEEVANYLRVSPKTVLSYRQKGMIKGIKVGKRYLYTKKEVINFLKNKMETESS